MKIISHRGYWKTSEEKNTETAFRRSFQLGFGTETDVRDLNGELVISHDMPKIEEEPLSFEKFLEIYNQYNSKELLALNIKSDGLQKKISIAIKKYSINNYYLFDMSIPDTILTMKSKLNFLTRQSDIELNPVLVAEAKGIWMDEFEKEWITSDSISKIIENKRMAFIVSAELHGRENKHQWEKIYNIKILKSECVVLCTDNPEKANEYFKVNN